MKWSDEEKNSLKIDYIKMSISELESKYNRKYDTIKKQSNLLKISKIDTRKSENIDMIINKCKNKNYTFINFIDEYKNGDSYFNIKCNEDGHIWKTNFYNFIKNDTNCTKCSGKLKLTYEFVLDKILNKCKDKNYDFLGFINEYKNTNFSYFELKCNIDGHIWKTIYNDFINGDYNCIICVGKYKKSYEEVINKILNKCENKNYHFLGFVTSYKNSYSIFKLKCLTDNYVWETNFNKFISSDTGCHICGIWKSINTKIEKGIFKSSDLKTEYEKYRKLVNNISRKHKNQLFENWNGYDYYDNEYIKDVIDYKSKNYRSVDHKISVIYGFINNISPEEIGHLENLCITKRFINSSKNRKTEEEFLKHIK